MEPWPHARNSMNRMRVLTSALLLVSSGVAGIAHGQADRWPIQPNNQDHPLGATLGEFNDVGTSALQHAGIDILATPCSNPCVPGDPSCNNPCTQTCGADPTAASTEPCVYVTVGGQVSECRDMALGVSGFTRITANTRTYEYVHLKYGSFDAQYWNRCVDKGTVESGSPSLGSRNIHVPITTFITGYTRERSTSTRWRTLHRGSTPTRTPPRSRRLI